MQAVIIVAGGSGTRMGTAVPKQFLPIGGKPVLMHTLDRFHAYDEQMQLVLVLPATQHDYWRKLCENCHYELASRLTLATGGDSRFQSVKNGLACVHPEATLIGVHDGVRPFVSLDVIANCYQAAAQTGAAIPVTDVVETLRQLCPEGGSTTVPRTNYRLVQTPQVFHATLLREAYLQTFSSQFTDDASVVESWLSIHPSTYSLSLVDGNRENIKITTPFDLTVAQSYVCKEKCE